MSGKTDNAVALVTTLAATALGRRTLVADGRRAPLFRGDGRAAHLTIAVEGS